MAYYTGTATDLADLHTKFLGHALADGWAWAVGDVISKAGVYFQIQVTATNITCLGCESNAVANPAPSVVSLGRIWQRSGYTIREISFPCNYEVFGFAQELYLVVNYDVDSYQWVAFGKSTVPGLSGQGGWCGATIGAFGTSVDSTDPIDISTLSGAANVAGQVTSAAMAWATLGPGTGATAKGNCWVNHGLDAHGWTYNGATYDPPIGIRHTEPLIGLQPSVWNSEATLIPVRAYKQRPSFKSSLILDLANARHLRIDNLSPGDILTLGSDKWKVFPWYRKNSANRNGGGSVNHTGTFGWAIRYEGP